MSNYRLTARVCDTLTLLVVAGKEEQDKRAAEQEDGQRRREGLAQAAAALADVHVLPQHRRRRRGGLDGQPPLLVQAQTLGLAQPPHRAGRIVIRQHRVTGLLALKRHERRQRAAHWHRGGLCLQLLRLFQQRVALLLQHRQLVPRVADRHSPPPGGLLAPRADEVFQGANAVRQSLQLPVDGAAAHEGAHLLHVVFHRLQAVEIVLEWSGTREWAVRGCRRQRSTKQPRQHLRELANTATAVASASSSPEHWRPWLDPPSSWRASQRRSASYRRPAGCPG